MAWTIVNLGWSRDAVVAARGGERNYSAGSYAESDSLSPPPSIQSSICALLQSTLRSHSTGGEMLEYSLERLDTVG